MIEGKGLGNKKVNRVNVSLSNKYETKLRRLAVSCNMRPTTLAARLIELSLDSPEVVYTLQNKFNVHNAYKVIPLEDYATREIELVLTDKE